MPKRDPAKTAINKKIDSLTTKLKVTEAHVIAALEAPNLQSMHARIGGKNDEFVDLKHEMIPSPESYLTHWIRGFLRVLRQRARVPDDTYWELYDAIKRDHIVEEYVWDFQKCTFLATWRP